ncbi:hypothetical protein HK105_203166 [Polyrhizophydium stewartii]|uniref:Large ribosomal subunit protein mL49 n=1 Tax=Polyrhizophydium stewartii TaxID=2732419 RepID=A0ABR4NC79_9FUNG
MQRATHALALVRPAAGPARAKTSYANLPKVPVQKSRLVAPLEQLEVIPKELLPYEIKRRERSGWLPVYSEFRNGKTRKMTLVRDVRGDIGQLKRDLGTFIPEERIQIKAGGTKLEITGDYISEIRGWLTQRRF